MDKLLIRTLRLESNRLTIRRIKFFALIIAIMIHIDDEFHFHKVVFK